MKKIKEVLKIIIISFALLIGISSTTFAANTIVATPKDGVLVAAGMGEILDAGREFRKAGQYKEEGLTIEYFAGEFAGIGSILVSIGVAVLVIVISIMGIKWITAKPDKKAQLKQQFVGVVVAAIVLFGAVGIWQLVQDIMEQVDL